MKTDLSKYNNQWYNPGGGVIKRSMWFIINALFFTNPLNPSSSIKVLLLKWFGAKIGARVVIKPGVNIKYPWKLTIGNNTWIGERVWIDNLDQVTIGENCCLSQEALLLCGNHHYGRTTFDLMITPIILEDGVWIGARSLLTGGVTCFSHSVLTAYSMTSKDLLAYTIYGGSPALPIKKRILTE
jgi:putative colanic acid biosynthesis acetyltransferase WcaF